MRETEKTTLLSMLNRNIHSEIVDWKLQRQDRIKKLRNSGLLVNLEESGFHPASRNQGSAVGNCIGGWG